MKPYAYFPFNEENEAVTLFTFIDKKIQGEKIPNFTTVSDIHIRNIYLSDNFNKLLKSYFILLNDFMTLIEKYSSDGDSAYSIDLFLEETKKLMPNKNYLKNEEYLNLENWEINKLIFMENKESAFYRRSKKIMELFFLIGLQAKISFYECSYYLNTMARLEPTNFYKSDEKIRDIKDLQKIIDKNKDLLSISLDIIAYSAIERGKQAELIKNLNCIIHDKKEFEEIKKMYFRLLRLRSDLLGYMNKVYFTYGKEEKEKSKKLKKSKQREENRKKFNSPTGMSIDVNLEQSVCTNCGEINDIIYNINLYTPIKHMVSSVCINCLLSIANNLNETMRQQYTSHQISSQLMVNYKHYSKPFDRCHICGYFANKTLELVAVRDDHTVILCKKCTDELIKLIDKKRNSHHTLKMEIKNSNQKT